MVPNILQSTELRACMQLASSMAALVWSSFDVAARCPNLVGVSFGAVAGLVASVPACGHLNCFGAITTGFLAGFFAWCAPCPASCELTGILRHSCFVLGCQGDPAVQLSVRNPLTSCMVGMYITSPPPEDGSVGCAHFITILHETLVSLQELVPVIMSGALLLGHLAAPSMVEPFGIFGCTAS